MTVTHSRLRRRGRALERSPFIIVIIIIAIIIIIIIITRHDTLERSPFASVIAPPMTPLYDCIASMNACVGVVGHQQRAMTSR